MVCLFTDVEVLAMSAVTVTKQERINLRLEHRAKQVLERAARLLTGG